jgi:aminoglycoside phosphotransferase (APT) family kinase protein
MSAYLTSAWGEPVEFEDIHQIPGGASRETYRVSVKQAGLSQGIILRRDPQSSLIDTERALEFRTYQAVYKTGFPVPEPLLLEETHTPLDRPFSLMAEIPGCETATTNFALPPWQGHREKLAVRKWTLLGELAAMNIQDLGVTDFMEVPEHPAARELDYWSGVVRNDSLHPEPVAEAAIRWLERHLPEPSQVRCLVHGDYRSGNFLYDTEGEIQGVLDWEMAHIGDPLEDLAWSLDPLWPWPDKTLAGGLVPRSSAIRIWESSYGVEIDYNTFAWWQVFASLKALAIWISSTEDFAKGAGKEPILAVAGWLMSDRHNRILVDRLHPESRHHYTEVLT